MVVLKHLTAHLAAGLMVTGALANPTPQVSDVSSENIAATFVSELISNATQLQEEQKEQVESLEKRGLLADLFCTQSSNLVVDLGYAKYRGAANTASGVNSWQGSEHPELKWPCSILLTPPLS